jgi:hypothetical protein
VSIGYGEFEVRALMVTCMVGGDSASSNTAAAGRLFATMADSFSQKIATFPPDFRTAPPADVAFKDWSAPWKLLAEKAIAVLLMDENS